MNLRNPYVQGALLIVAAAVLAFASNAMASRQRKLILPGYYPNALKVPPKVVETAPAPTTSGAPLPSAAPVVTAAPAPAPVPAPPKVAAEGGGAPQKQVVVAEKPAEAPRKINLLERFAPHPDKAYVEIGGADVEVLYANGALFLDARRTSVFEEGHIAGARSFSVWESDIDDKVAKLFEERGDPDQQLQPIVIYCSGGACEDSHMLAQKLWGLQFNNVYVYKDGFPDWQKRGGRTATGAK